MAKSVRLRGHHFLAVAANIAFNQELRIAKTGKDSYDDYSCCNFTELDMKDERKVYQKVLHRHGIDPDSFCFGMPPSQGFSAAERNEQRIMFLCLLAAQANYRKK